MDKLSIITSTTRPGRKGIAIARWLTDFVEHKNVFDVELLDLAEIGLPLMDEPSHPRLRKYEHEHTRKWSQLIDSADAYIMVLAEYNFSIPAPIKNAFDFLYHEWRYKPIGFVSYGGISGGLRSMQMMKQVVTALNMMPLSESVPIPDFSKHINKDGQFTPYELLEKSVDTMVNELLRWSEEMKNIRELHGAGNPGSKDGKR